MGAIQSSSKEDTGIIDFNKKMYVVIDLYFKSKIDNKKLNFAELKTSVSLKKQLRDIIMNAFLKENLSVSLSENNLLLISKVDKNNDRIEYLELNAVVEFSQTSKEENRSIELKRQKLKLNILSELFAYTSNKYGIVVSPDTTVIILHNTLSEIEIYQK